MRTELEKYEDYKIEFCMIFQYELQCDFCNLFLVVEKIKQGILLIKIGKI